MSPGSIGAGTNLVLSLIPLVCAKTITSADSEYASLGLSEDLSVHYKILYGVQSTNQRVVGASILSSTFNSTGSTYLLDSFASGNIRIAQNVDGDDTDQGVWSFAVSLSSEDIVSITASYTDTDLVGSPVSFTFTTSQSTLADGVSPECSGTLYSNQSTNI